MSLITNLVEANLSNEALGAAVSALATAGAVSNVELGAALSGSPVGDVNLTDVVSRVTTVSPPVPHLDDLSDSERDAIIRTIYQSFNNYRRRTVSALARETGLNNDDVLRLIEPIGDFRTSMGRTTGTTYVSIRDVS